jgi:hypothetical protein
MATWGQDFLKGFFGNDYLRDYRHASKTFTTNGYELAPRHKFLYHVYFNVNIGEIPRLKVLFGSDASSGVSTIGLLCKTIDLPKYDITTEVMNQYNRKRIVQTKLNYKGVRAVFHDDGGDLIRSLWYAYMSYYYKDPSQAYDGQANTAGTSGQNANRQAGFSYNSRDVYSDVRVGNVNDWGYIGESFGDTTKTNSGKPPFFKDIRIYGFNQHKFVEYTMINPLITNWTHDTYDYSSNELMTNSVEFDYETVKYYSGAIGGSRPADFVKGFANPDRYDQGPSPLQRAGGTRSILGQGGLVDAGIGIYEDLMVKGDVVGAIAKAGRTFETFKQGGLKQAAIQEGISVAREVLKGGAPNVIRQGTNAVNGFFFPKKTTTQQQQTLGGGTGG